MSHDLEDRLMEAPITAARFVGRLIYRHAWAVAERVFKLVAWGTAVVGLAALQSKVQSTDLNIVIWLLALLWAAAFLVTVLTAMVSLQDAMIARRPDEGRSRILWVVTTLIGSLAILYVFADFLAPIVFRAFLAIYAVAGLK
ncbi:hypothetical protein [Ferrovibrio sp.]|uniref:hypothetical protein n=1 Tax=Ferrovibrio sp. TaxID=1917215 RepID=UPI00311F20C8